MSKKMCKWEKKDIEKKLDKIKELVNDPRFICSKCARVANLEDNLCKPMKLK